ncbi:lamin tail domain-containing protein [Nocardioides sp. CPCC 205120]|uniref:lamin tail domain-containing protein n=1 Tax=Nocardioides sp. CPCC 205120 TaxID=3406462 RepID=UPI003B507A19
MPTPRTRYAALGALPLLGLGLLAPLGAQAAETVAPAAVSSVVINEIAQNSGDTDWVELHNTGSTPVDVTGWRLLDNDDTRDFPLATGSVVPAGGFLSVDVSEDVPGREGFGLGRADMVRLLLPAGQGDTPVDSYSWTDHTATTYGRCADGTGAFTQTAAPTRDAANACVAEPADVVRINEVESSDPAGGPDWIELVNTGSVPVDLSGLVVKDDNDARTDTIPAGTVLAPGAFHVVEPTFGLGGADEARVLDGDLLVDRHAWTAHATTTWGRYPDGTGVFAETAAATRGAANLPVAAATPDVVVNEVESSGGTPGDWIELLNRGASDVDLSGYVVGDSDATHRAVLPAGSVAPAGGFLVVEESTLGFGLGSSDQARLFLPDGFTVVDERSWSGHAPTTYGRCGDAWVVTTSPTKGAANDCGAPVRINEVESSGGTPGDWVEIVNNGVEPFDLSGWVVSDDDDTHRFVVPAGTVVPAGGHWVADVDAGEAGFGLGGADTARLFDPAGALVDSYGWTAHAPTTWGRCPDGTGDFAATAAPTRGAVNQCAGDVVTEPWPGPAEVRTADPAGTYAENMSGLVFTPDGSALWAVQNNPGSLHRLVRSGEQWVADAGWTGGRALHYADGTGNVDAEGVTVGPDGLYVASERNNDGGGSRPSILRYDVSGDGAFSATGEWNLAPELPGIGANAGLEGITWVPSSVLVEQGLVDQSTGAAYDPARYPDADGVFLVGVEATGDVLAYALGASGTFTRVASFASGFPGVMEVQHDPATGAVWVYCDEACGGRTTLFEVDASGAFAPTVTHARPAGMPDIANEGLALAPVSRCTDGLREVVWADDSSTDGHAIRTGAITCTGGPVDPEPEPEPEVPAPGSLGTGSSITPAPQWRYARTGAAKPIAVYYEGEDRARLTGTVYTTLRQAGTGRLIATAHAYGGGRTTVATPVVPRVKASYQVVVTFVPDDPAYRTSVRSFWVWATPTGRP